MKQLINTQLNSEPELFYTATKSIQSQYNSLEPFHPSTPVIQECKTTQTLPTPIKISAEQYVSLEEQNNILKSEIKELNV